MNIAITTPTGKVGRATTEVLMKSGASVTLLARNPQKVAHFTRLGAKVKQGSLEDEAFVLEATRGADVLFWVTPPQYVATDMRVYQERLGRIAAAAVRAVGIERVVHLSSIGAQHLQRVGPISGLGAIEQTLNQTAAHVSHLRPTFFMENFFMHLQSIATGRRIAMPLPGSLKMPAIATRDIGQVAAARILDVQWTGRSVLELVGPSLHSLEESVQILGKAIGTPISFVTASDEQTKAAMLGMGMSENVADLMLEMYAAFRQNRVAPEGQPRITTTTLEQWAAEVFRPAYQQVAQATA
jgi:uncharacterized protein YbjT (DUF2867 family)